MAPQIERRKLNRRIEDLLDRIEKALSAGALKPDGPRRRTSSEPVTEAPHRPGRAQVAYVALRGKAEKELSPRARQVHALMRKHRKMTAADLRDGLHVNRNVIAGALHELRRTHLVKSEQIHHDN